MKLTRKLILVSICSVVSNAQAAPMTLLSGSLSNQTVFAHTYVSGGAGPAIVANGQTVNGNILANQDITLGDSAKVSGNTQSRDLTTGNGAIISGNVTTSGDSTIGAYATVSGELKSVDTTLGAHATVSGNVVTTADITLGDTAKIDGNLHSGVAVTLGANAKVAGTLQHGGALVVSGSATPPIVIAFTGTPPATVIADEHQGVLDAQAALAAMVGTTIAPGDLNDAYADANLLNPFMAGVYNVNGLLTTTAGITLTLDANHQDSAFIFNVSNYLSFGAGTIIDVINAIGTDTNVIWNSHGAGGYTSIGANSEIVGLILATTYASVGANASVTGVNSSCGGVFSATSYVSLGANASVGSTGCSDVSEVPIPAAAFLFAPALLGLMGLRRKVKITVA